VSIQTGADHQRSGQELAIADRQLDQVAAGQQHAGLVDRPRVDVVAELAALDLDGHPRAVVVGDLRVVENQVVVGEVAAAQRQCGVSQPNHGVTATVAHRHVLRTTTTTAMA